MLNATREMTREDNRVLLKWGGICTYLSVVAFVALVGASMIIGGLAWKLWLPLFSIVICLWVIVLLAGYEYLKKTHNALAKIGAAFGALLIVVLFAEVAAWGADRMVLKAASGADGGGL